jgi:threonine/homoserine/homoserine lactone efflux protein
LEAGFYLRGLLIGVAIAAPVGPIGVLCIRRTLAYGRASGLVSGLGAATADAVYGSIAAFGLTVVANLLVENRATLQLIGGAFLIYLGLRTMFDKPKEIGLDLEAFLRPNSAKPWQGMNWRALSQDFVSTFLLTLTNPMTILSFVAIFAGLGAASSSGGGVWVVAGVFSGSALWWIVLSLTTGALRGWLIGSSRLQWVNWISGAILLSYGGLSLVGLVKV